VIQDPGQGFMSAFTRRVRERTLHSDSDTSKGGRMVKKKFEDIPVGGKVSFGKTITEADVFAFAGITADFNPIHVNANSPKILFSESGWPTECSPPA